MRQAVHAAGPGHVGGATAAAPARDPRTAALVLLQRSAGNAAVGRVLARQPAPQQAPPARRKQWQNEQLLKDIYPGREEMLRTFVTMYREIAGEKDGTPVDGLSGDALLAEVTRLFDSGAAPAWLRDMVLDYAGMRYKSAHGSYFNPIGLVVLILRESGELEKSRTADDQAATAEYDRKLADWETTKKGAKPAKPKTVKTSTLERGWRAKSIPEAEEFLIAEHAAGRIPEWAWHKIVRVTELKNRLVTGPGWEDETQEKADPADKGWIKIMKEWTADTTQWRGEIMRRDELVTSRMVCNELSEAAQRKRGVNLSGGISKNAEQFRKSGSFFKHPESADDFQPGGGIFWINTDSWVTEEPDDSNKVRYIDGVTYPMPVPPEYIADWKAWAATKEGKQQLADKQRFKTEHGKWEQRKKAHDAWEAKQKGKEPAAPGDEPVAPVTTEPQKFWSDKLPATSGVGPDGWTYTLTAGQPITREKEIDGKLVKHWMRWLHQATVLRAMPGGRIFTMETTGMRTGDTGVSGFRVRTLASLQSPSVFVGYIPTKDEPAAVQAPASTPQPTSSEPPGPYPNSCPAPWYTPPVPLPFPFPVPVPG